MLFPLRPYRTRTCRIGSEKLRQLKLRFSHFSTPYGVYLPTYMHRQRHRCTYEHRNERYRWPRSLLSSLSLFPSLALKFYLSPRSVSPFLSPRVHWTLVKTAFHLRDISGCAFIRHPPSPEYETIVSLDYENLRFEKFNPEHIFILCSVNAVQVKSILFCALMWDASNQHTWCVCFN